MELCIVTLASSSLNNSPCCFSKLDFSFLTLIKFSLASSDKKFRSDRRSLYFTVDLKKGSCIQPDHIRSVRPGHGLPTSMFDTLIGKVLTDDVIAGQPVSLDHFFTS